MKSRPFSRFGLGAITILGATLTGCAPDTSEEFRLEPALAASQNLSDDITYMNNVTDEVCPEAGCVEAWDTDYATYLRFPTERDAMIFAAVHSDTRVADRFLGVDFEGYDADALRRSFAVSYIITWHAPF